jgi:hypothetical protein
MLYPALPGVKTCNCQTDLATCAFGAITPTSSNGRTAGLYVRLFSSLLNPSILQVCTTTKKRHEALRRCDSRLPRPFASDILD